MESCNNAILINFFTYRIKETHKHTHPTSCLVAQIHNSNTNTLYAVITETERGY